MCELCKEGVLDDGPDWENAVEGCEYCGEGICGGCRDNCTELFACEGCFDDICQHQLPSRERANGALNNPLSRVAGCGAHGCVAKLLCVGCWNVGRHGADGTWPGCGHVKQGPDTRLLFISTWVFVVGLS